MPYYLKRCAEILRGSTVKASTTIGFPHGGHTTAIKVAEAQQALADGGQELDMVVNISKVLSGDWDYVRADIAAVVDVTHAAGPEGQGHLRELLPEGRAEDPALRDLRRAERRLGEDLHRLRHRRGDHRGPEADAAARAGTRAGQGRRRRPRPGQAAGSARPGRHPRAAPPARPRCSTNANAGSRCSEPKHCGPPTYLPAPAGVR